MIYTENYSLCVVPVYVVIIIIMISVLIRIHVLCTHNTAGPTTVEDIQQYCLVDPAVQFAF